MLIAPVPDADPSDARQLPPAPPVISSNRPPSLVQPLPLPSPATVHVDLDGAREIYEGHGWGYRHADDRIFESGMQHLLAFLAENEVKATLFVIARSVRDPARRALLEAAVRQGHEIASHSMHHRYLPQLDAKEKRVEIAESRHLLEQTLGVPVSGFRAPGYRIDRESVEMMAEHGYGWDSSAYPTAHYAEIFRRPVDALCAPHAPVAGSPFVEWPLPDHRPLPIPFNPSYALLLGDWLFRHGVERVRRRGGPLSLLFHLIDLAEPLPANRQRGLSSKIFTLSNLPARTKRERCQRMLDLVKAHYRIVTTETALAEWRTRPAAGGADGSRDVRGEASAGAS